MRHQHHTLHLARVLLAAVFLALNAHTASAWWNPDWSGRVPILVDPTVEGAGLPGEPGEVVILIRLHPGILPFEAVNQDGSDLRFIAADDQTPLDFHLEKFDPVMGEGFAWVRLPATTGKTNLWLYHGNPQPASAGAPDPHKTYPPATRLIYHLDERGTPPRDATKNAADAETAGSISEGTIIGSGLRLVGRDPVRIPGHEALQWRPNGDLTIVLWVRPAGPSGESILLSRPDARGFRLGLTATGAPFLEINGTPRAVAGENVGAGTWRQIAVVASGPRMSLLVDGRETAVLEAGLPAGVGPLFLGGPDPATGTAGRFVGELDELQVHGTALPPAALRLAFLSQAGTELSSRVVAAGDPEGGAAASGGMLEHLALFGDIANNMMFDGWIAVAVCVVMMIVGWSVAAAKFRDLSRIERGNAAFQALWAEVAGDLTVLDLDAPESSRALGTHLTGRQRELVTAAPLYHIYHVGAEEIRHRLAQDRYRGQGLRARSIQAIRAALDTALVHEQHRLGKGLTYLTISIAGGPYVGLLGTVVGVMITFAVIAKSGEVDVNSIAPGIASALLATTVGLLVAIPALFMYSFLSSRIKAVIATMKVFIDEFVAKVAEFYPPPGEDGSPAPIRTLRKPEEVARLEEAPNPTGDR